MTFHVGMKVVCIRRRWEEELPAETSPVFNNIYTIRTIDEDNGDTMLRFAEIVNPILDYEEGFNECQFWARWFRPVVERKTSIDIFTQMLTPHGVDA